MKIKKKSIMSCIFKSPSNVTKEYNIETIKAVRMVNALQDYKDIINWYIMDKKINDFDKNCEEYLENK